MHGYRAISGALSAWTGSFLDFIRQLDEDGVPYLSFSKINAVESCQQQYLLEYVKRTKFDEPGYYRKGTIFHRAASLAYHQLGNGGLNMKPIERLAQKHFDEEETAHILNAVKLLVDNAPANHELIATEMPFVLSLGSRMPPLIGVIDLLLRKGDTFIVVDHKSGKNLYEQDGFQLHLYREHVQRTFKPQRCRAYFDEYRWVNNLARIRIPAFRRTPVRPKSWATVLGRVQKGLKVMRRIERTGEADGGSGCYFCPVSDVCSKATFEWNTW